MADAAEGSGNKIKVNVKTSKDKKEIEVDGEGTIKEVRNYQIIGRAGPPLSRETACRSQY